MAARELNIEIIRDLSEKIGSFYEKNRVQILDSRNLRAMACRELGKGRLLEGNLLLPNIPHIFLRKIVEFPETKAWFKPRPSMPGIWIFLEEHIKMR